jgi:hypothetical protein
MDIIIILYSITVIISIFMLCVSIRHNFLHSGVFTVKDLLISIVLMLMCFAPIANVLLLFDWLADHGVVSGNTVLFKSKIKEGV